MIKILICLDNMLAISIVKNLHVSVKVMILLRSIVDIICMDRVDLK